MSRELSLWLSVLASLIFTLAVLISSLLFAPEGQIKFALQPAEQEQLMAGRDAGTYIGQELLPEEKININRADAEQLQRLPGIGEVISAAIVEYRHENGPFKSIEEIMDVPGIGEGKFAAMADNITIGEKRT